MVGSPTFLAYSNSKEPASRSEPGQIASRRLADSWKKANAVAPARNGFAIQSDALAGQTLGFG